MAGSPENNSLSPPGKLPLVFIGNKGQVHEQVKFYVRAGGQTLWLTPAGIVFDLLRMTTGSSQTQPAAAALRLDPLPRASKQHVTASQRLVFTQSFMGANAGVRMEARRPQPGSYNYILGKDPAMWRTGVRAYAEVIYRQVWEGVDCKLYGKWRTLEQEFIVRPGGDLGQIRMAYHGIEGLQIAADGSLVIHTAFGEMRESPPRIYQEIHGQRLEVDGHFKLLSNTAYTFAVAPYQSAYALIIDPPLLYSTYLGGNDLDSGFGIAVDIAGNTYVTGQTSSTNFPTAAPFQSAPANALPAAFVTKLNATGSALVYSTYLGGSAEDSGRSIAVDAAGNAYVAGLTLSPDFPVNAGAFQTSRKDLSDAFVAKLNATGSVLLYATYLGGNSLENISLGSGGIAVDAAGNAYVTGETWSRNFPTVNAVQETFGGGESDAFVTKLNATGSALEYSTYLGGRREDVGHGIAVDAMGNAYVTGETRSPDFPTVNAVQPALGGDTDAFVARLNAAGTGLVYSTYLGGGDTDTGNGIAVDVMGNAYVTGETFSRNFPVRTPALQARKNFLSDSFVTRLNAAGSALLYSTYLGGNGFDAGRGIVVDATGSVYVTGQTESTDFPTVDPLQPASGGDTDVFVTRLNSTGSGLVYSTYLGGSGIDVGHAIAVDIAGNAYVTGNLFLSTDFPTVEPVQAAYGGDLTDAFVARIGRALPPGLLVSAIVPARGGDIAAISVLMHGSGFTAATTVRLRRTGQADIVGDPGRVAANGETVATTFDLTNKARGAWDVLVTNPDGTSVTLPDGFSIEAGRAPEVWVDIVGRQLILFGRQQTFNILYGNRGNVDAVGVPLWIAGIPRDASWELGFEITPPPQLEGDPPVNWDEVPVHIETDDEILIPLFIPVIPPGFTGVLQIKLTIPSERQFQLRTWVNAPFFQSPLGAKVVDCHLALLSTALNALGIVPGVNCLTAIVLRFGGMVTTVVQTSRENFTLDNRLNLNYSLLQIESALFNGVLGPAATCAGDLVGVARIGAVVGTVLAGVDAIIKCADSFRLLLERLLDIFAIGAIDPNDKVGSLGAGEQHYLARDEPLRYMILFENLETATAPAQEALITDQLDGVHLDLSTLSLGPITFGDTEIIPPPGLSQFATTVDLRPETNLLVRVEAGLDTALGLFVWRFTSLDPETGGLPDDPLLGFLPPNLQPPQGEGSVLFTVMPRDNLPTGTEIRNQASIVFNVNPPIATPEWLNTLDNNDPTSQVLSLADTQDSPDFEVQWSGTDAGSGVRNYTIFVSEDRAPSVVWLSNTTTTAATFSGQAGSAYTFYSIAQDEAGNLEEAPVQADATTRVAGCFHDGDVDLNGSLTPADAVQAWQHFLGVAPAQLDTCRQSHANVDAPRTSAITPADALCIFRGFLGVASCLE